MRTIDAITTVHELASRSGISARVLAQGINIARTVPHGARTPKQRQLLAMTAEAFDMFGSEIAGELAELWEAL